MKWYNPFSYFTADVKEDGKDAVVDATSSTPVQPAQEESNPIGTILFLIIVAVCVYLFYSNCRPVGQRMGVNGKMETIYDCTGKPPQTVMYAQPGMVAQPVMYAQPGMTVVQQPSSWIGFGRGHS